ncbi:MAG: hypothetical protein OXG15_10920, partial [Gammaproteobacteria bacterium]|nr:hypothetical protein [Gammaproteobacteria bacterium]
STAQVEIARQSFERVLAACGIPPSLFAGNADGTSQREGLRRWHMSTVLPLARMLEHELTAKLGSAVKLRFDGYAMDMVSRASVASKLAAVEGVSVQQALEIAGLIENE